MGMLVIVTHIEFYVPETMGGGEALHLLDHLFLIIIASTHFTEGESKA